MQARRFTLAILFAAALVAALAPATALAQEPTDVEIPSQRVSPATAVLFSGGGDALAWSALLAGAFTKSDALLLSGSAAVVLLPSAGQYYAGDIYQGGIQTAARA